MKTPAAEKQGSAKPVTPKITVDENVVRKMLKVNPTLRQGRTTSQVKTSLERGETLTGQSAPDATPAATSLPAGASELRDTMTFFLRGKLEALGAKEAEIGERRKALDAELASARATVGEQVQTFLGLLDQEMLAKHGSTAFAEHAKALAALGLDTRTLVDGARRGGKS